MEANMETDAETNRREQLEQLEQLEPVKIVEPDIMNPSNSPSDPAPTTTSLSEAEIAALRAEPDVVFVRGGIVYVGSYDERGEYVVECEEMRAVRAALNDVDRQPLFGRGGGSGFGGFGFGSFRQYRSGFSYGPGYQHPLARVATAIRSRFVGSVGGGRNIGGTKP